MIKTKKWFWHLSEISIKTLFLCFLMVYFIGKAIFMAMAFNYVLKVPFITKAKEHNQDMIKKMKVDKKLNKIKEKNNGESNN